MSLKKPTPRRFLKDHNTVTRPIPVDKKSRKPASTSTEPRKRALDHKKVWEMKLQKKLAERKKVGDASFEITEENFRQLIKETLVEVLKEHRIIQTETSEELPTENDEPGEKIELESVVEEEITPKETVDGDEEIEEEIELEAEEEEEKEKIEDDDLITAILNDPAKKQKFVELLKDKETTKKAGDAAGVFVSTFDRYASSTPKQTRVEPEASPSGYNRYAIK